MGKTYKHQNDYLHDNKELTKHEESKLKHQFSRTNYSKDYEQSAKHKDFVRGKRNEY